MDWAVRRVGAIRPYAYEYVVGVLWILAVASLLLHQDSAIRGAEFLDRLVAATPHIRVPDFAVGFLIAIVGVLLPYCAAIAASPPTIAVMNATRWLRRKRYQPDREIVGRATAIIVSDTGLSSGVHHDSRMVYLAARNPRSAERLASAADAIMFRVRLLLPLSILLGTGIGRLFWVPWPSVAGITAWAIGLLLFMTGSHAASRAWDRHDYNTDLAIILTSKRGEKTTV